MRLVWNRKRTVGLVGLEIFICFLVLAGLGTGVVHYVGLYQRPLGFDWDNVWAVSIHGLGYGDPEDVQKTNRISAQDLLRAAHSMPEVEAAAIATNQPYGSGSWITTTYVGGKQVGLHRTYVSVRQKDVFRINIRQGRWLEESDAAYDYLPIVISQNVAEGMFPGEDPIGKNLPRFDDNGKALPPGEVPEGHDATIYRVVGVSDNYHRFGELGDDVYAMFIPINFETSSELPNEIMIRVRPGTGALFEERLLRTFQQVAPQWTYDTEYLPDRRRSNLMETAAPMFVLAVVGLFLVIMVGLGLVGVLWLNVTRRTSELGLRRAMGASAQAVRRQVLGELWALTALAVTIGTVIFLQVPLFGANFGVGWYVFVLGVVFAAITLVGFVTLCGLYPAWLATRVQPATALQYE